MPRDLYELMLDALRQTRASVVSPVEPTPVELPPVVAPPVAKSFTETSDTLPRDVQDACRYYAFGDPLEEAANYTRAVALKKANRRPEDIIREIRQGANPEAFI